MNRAVALGEVHGPGLALAALESVDLEGYHPFHLVRADLLGKLGRIGEARAEYDKARACVGNETERRYIDGLCRA